MKRRRQDEKADFKACAGLFQALYWLSRSGLISAVLSVGMTLYAPILIGRGIDQIIGPGNVDFKAILSDIAWLAGTVAVGALFQWLLAQCTNILAYRTVRDLRVSVFDKLERVPLKYIDSNAHGDLISRVVNDIDQVSDGLLQGFTQLFTGVVTILGTLGFMLSVSPWIALVVVVLTPLSLFVSAFIAKRSYQNSESSLKREASSADMQRSWLAGSGLLRPSAMSSARRKRLRRSMRASMIAA